MAEDPNKTKEQKEQERYRQEIEMARGPVSRGASNKDAPMYQDQRQPSPTTHHDKSPDYNKMIKQRTSGTPLGSGMPTDSDVGTVGGGTIPNPGRGTGEPRGGRATTNSTAGAGGSSGGSVIGAGSTRDRGTMSNEEMDVSTNEALEQQHQTRGKVPTRIANHEPDTPSSRNANKIDRTAQSNIGGRNPDQPQTSMGERDPAKGKHGRSNDPETSDPMTSRAPHKTKKK